MITTHFELVWGEGRNRDQGSGGGVSQNAFFFATAREFDSFYSCATFIIYWNGNTILIIKETAMRGGGMESRFEAGSRSIHSISGMFTSSSLRVGGKGQIALYQLKCWYFGRELAPHKSDRLMNFFDTSIFSVSVFRPASATYLGTSVRRSFKLAMARSGRAGAWGARCLGQPAS